MTTELEVRRAEACCVQHGWRQLAALLLALALLQPDDSRAAGSSFARRSVKIFRGLVVEGERPEISACLTVALQDVGKSSPYARIHWSPALSNRAVVEEDEVNGTPVRTTTFRASATPRSEAAFRLADAPTVTVVISCRQIDEARPSVRFDPER